MPPLPLRSAPVRIVLAMDVEPDARWPGRIPDERWLGTLAAFDAVARLRDTLARVQPSAPAFTWLVRADEQIAAAWGDRGHLLELFRDRFADLAAAGDDVGLHSHLFRPDGDGWVIDNASADWRREIVERAAATFREKTGRVAAVHSFGDRALFPDSLDVLERAGILLDLTVEPGFRERPVFRFDETLRGVVPDHSRAPRELWRPALDDWMRDDPASPRRIRLLPVATRRVPWWMEPGRRIDLMRRRLRSDPFSMDELDQRWVRLCVSHRAYVLRSGCAQTLRERTPATLHFVLRVNAFADAASRRRILANLEWIARGGLGAPVEFVSATGLLSLVDAEAGNAPAGLAA